MSTNKKQKKIYYYPDNDNPMNNVRAQERERFGNLQKKLEFLHRIKNYEDNFDKKINGYELDLQGEFIYKALFKYNLKHHRMGDKRLINNEELISLNLLQQDIEKEIHTFNYLADNLYRVDYGKIFETSKMPTPPQLSSDED